jgi:hypothetical protein
MDKQPSFDRELLLPILVGGFSIFGIIIILLIGRLNASRASVDVIETETPFKYIFLGTEPLNSTGSPEASGTELATDLPLESPTPLSPETTSTLGTPAPGTPTLGTPNGTASPGFPPNSGTGPPINGTSPAGASPTTTFASGPPPLNPGTYDDAHPALGYSPAWSPQTGVSGAFEGTIHVSTSLGSSISFRFIGRELRVFYLSGASLGEITIAIDGQSSTVDQSDLSSGNEWISNPLTNNTHTVVITHLSGGSVNLDQVIIPEIGPTGTPTSTPTRTPTSTP